MSQGQLSWYMLLSGAALFFGSILAAGGITALLGKECDSFQQPAPEGEMWFRRPSVERIPAALFSLGFFGGVLIWVGICFDPMVAGGGPWTFLIAAAPCLGVSLWFLRRAGPEQVRIDLKAHTFQRVTGWPVFPVVASGTWKQIFGVYIRRVESTRSSPYYLVGFYWTGGRGVSVVGKYFSREAAEAEAQRLSAALGLRRVGAPR